jgi:hypothetical protein
MHMHNVLPMRTGAGGNGIVFTMPRTSREHDDDLLRRQTMILNIAQRIECDRTKCLQWFMHDGIAEFGYATADELLRQGMEDRLLVFLLGLIRKERQTMPAN